MSELIIFLSFASIMLFSSIMVITRKNAVPAAVYLVISMLCAAALYALMGADFVATIQVLVYAGAIMVLFLFVIMLLNTESDIEHGFQIKGPDFVMIGLTVLSFAITCIALMAGKGAVNAPVETLPVEGGNTLAVAKVLFVNYLWPFELASVLILMAIVASIVIAKRDSADH
jgi:NADH-quinone oxidoreductase subunit J